MKNTRKFLAAVMALAMISAIAPISASARGGEGEGEPAGTSLTENGASADTNVKYSVEPSYTVVIPADVTLSDSKDVTADIKLDKPETFKLAKDAKLSVKIESEEFKVTNNDCDVTYTILAGSTALTKGSVAAEFAEGNTSAKTLTFPKLDPAKAKYAGEYTGTLTFTIAVEDMSQVAVEGVSINNENVSQKVIWDADGYANSVTEGKSAKLSVAVSPTDATNKEVEWTSSDPSIATVDDEGNVTGVSHGSVTITATAKDGSGKKDTIRLHVAKPIATGVKWAASNYKADHADLLDFGEGVYVKSTWGGNTTKVTGTKVLPFIWFAEGDHYYSAFDGFGDDYNTADDGRGSEEVYGYEIKGSGTEADPFYGVPYHSEID